MRSMRAALLACAATTACSFAFTGVDAGAGSGDMSTGADLAGGDLGPCGCPNGCAMTPPVHCLALQPSGPVNGGDYGLAGLKPLSVTANIIINTDDGTIMGPVGLSRPAGAGVVNGIGFHVVMQTGAPGVGVFSVAGLTLASGVKISFKGGPAVTADVKQGAADLVITNTETVDALATGGDVVDNGKTLLMISKVGIAVKAGAQKPDVSTPDKLKAALMAAKTVGYSQGASGQHFETVIQKLGIADAVKAKAVVVQGRPVGAAIASGEAEIGVQQVAELRPVAGVDVIGELPPELQKKIPYSAGVSAKAKDAATARALVTFLRSQPAMDVLKRKGMDLP